MSREDFERRDRSRFIDPVFRPLDREVGVIVDAAWHAYSNSVSPPWGLREGRDVETITGRLADMSMISAGGMAETDGYIGYMKPYEQGRYENARLGRKQIGGLR